MTERICAHASCEQPHYGHGWCRRHYTRWKQHGDPDKVIERAQQRRATPVERFARRLAVQDNGCVLWTGAQDRDGYGRFSVGRKTGRAHRFAWEQQHGPIPADLQVDHLCGTPACVAVAHLQLVPASVNLARRRPERMSSAARARQPQPRRSVCGAGLHEMTPENSIERADGRTCRQCKRDRERAAYRARVGR